MILQNFVPHPRYYGREPARDRRRLRRRSTGAPASAPDAADVPLPDWALEGAGPVVDRRHARADRSGARAPAGRRDPGAAEPRRLVGGACGAGASDLGGLSSNGDHISPEHPFPSPHQVRKRLQSEGVALTERLCVYPRVHRREWLSARRARHDPQPLLVVHPAPRLRAHRRRRVRSAATSSAQRPHAAATA